MSPIRLAVLLMLAATGASAQTAAAQTAADTAAAALEPAQADTLRTAGQPDLVVLGDSAGRALDSAAVAALSDTSDALPDEVLDGTDVMLYGRRVFRVFGGLGALTAEQRATRIGERLDALTRNDAFDPDSLHIIEGATLTTIQFGDLIVMSVTDEDARAQTLGRAQAGEFYARRIREEINRVRERSTFRSVAINAGIAAALFVLLLVLLGLLKRASRWADERFILVTRENRSALTVRGIEVVRADQVVRVGLGVLRLVQILVSLLLVYIFLTIALGLFPWSQSWSRTLLAYLISPLKSLGAIVVNGLPDFFAIVVVILVVRWAIKGSNWLFHQIETGSLTLPGFYPEFAEPTRKIARFLLIIMGAFLAFPYTPLADNPAIQGLTVLIGILFSLGSSTAIANVVAGTVLTYTRSFQVGDRIKVGETVGDVVEKTFLVTRLVTPKNETVSVPNSAVLSGQVTNYSAQIREGRGVIVHTTVTIGYDVPWQKTHALLLEAARRAGEDDTIGVVPEPPPFVLQTSLGDFSVAYQLNAYTNLARKHPAVLSALHARIQDVFAEAEVEILSPVYEAHRDGNPLTLPGTYEAPGVATGPTVDGGPAIEPDAVPVGELADEPPSVARASNDRSVG